jgi:hypothetical protein
MKSRSGKRGASTSAPEVTHVSKRGLFLQLDGSERFLAFKLFPWFRDAPVRAVFNVRRPAPDHLRWPELDVDLDLDSFAHPERYPLVSRQPPATVSDRSSQQSVAAARRAQAAITKTPKPKPGSKKRPER